MTCIDERTLEVRGKNKGNSWLRALSVQSIKSFSDTVSPRGRVRRHTVTSGMDHLDQLDHLDHIRERQRGYRTGHHFRDGFPQVKWSKYFIKHKLF